MNKKPRYSCYYFFILFNYCLLVWVCCWAELFHWVCCSMFDAGIDDDLIFVKAEDYFQQWEHPKMARKGPDKF